MPIYEYRCQECGFELEKLQRMSDDPLRDCPSCEKPELKRLISAAAFRLKGSGWYETDFKQGEKRNLADGGDKPNNAKSETKTESKTESKAPAAKDASKSKKTESKSSSAAGNA